MFALIVLFLLVRCGIDEISSVRCFNCRNESFVVLCQSFFAVRHDVKAVGIKLEYFSFDVYK